MFLFNQQNLTWDKSLSDRDTLEFLRTLPRYRNSPLKSLYWRAAVFLKMLFCRVTGIDKPIYIVLVTNNNCNLACNYCYGDYGHKGHLKNYTTKELLGIIDELKELGTALLTIHGGEAMIRKDIGEVVNYAKLKGFYITININGVAIPKRLAEIRCVDNVVISLDGSEKAHDINRGEGSHAVAMNALHCVTEAGLPTNVHATITRKNLDELDNLVGIAKSVNSRLQFSILYAQDTLLQGQDTLVPTDEENRAFNEKILALRRSGAPIFYSENVIQQAINWPFKYSKRRILSTGDADYKEKSKGLIPCYHTRLKYYIDADGRVIPCWEHNRPEAPNVLEHGVAGAMKKCRDANTCKHCVFLANNEQNSLMHMSPRNLFDLVWIQVSDLVKRGAYNARIAPATARPKPKAARRHIPIVAAKHAHREPAAEATAEVGADMSR